MFQNISILSLLAILFATKLLNSSMGMNLSSALVVFVIELILLKLVINFNL